MKTGDEAWLPPSASRLLVSHPRAFVACWVLAVKGHGFLSNAPPALPAHSLPQVSAYPVVESGGFIWLFFGDLPEDLRPPLPSSFVPELHDRKWHAGRPCAGHTPIPPPLPAAHNNDALTHQLLSRSPVLGAPPGTHPATPPLQFLVYGEIEFDCGHWSVFENAIDMAHIHYLHSDSFGNASQPRIQGMTAAQPDAYHVESSFRWGGGYGGSAGAGPRHPTPCSWGPAPAAHLRPAFLTHLVPACQ
jgi:phenylpropionate dioxygenase-like ring-hydroxylating dioxygenase large terminal subunit